MTPISLEVERARVDRPRNDRRRGLGQAIFTEKQVLHYETLATYVIAAVVLVLGIDGLVDHVGTRSYNRILAR